MTALMMNNASKESIELLPVIEKLNGRDHATITGLIIFGLLGNHFNLHLFFGVDFIFGSIAAIIALRCYGLFWGGLTAIIVSSYTYVLWQHAYAVVIFTCEILFIGAIVKFSRIRDYLLCDLAYWLIMGMPMCWFFYSHQLELPQTSVYQIMVKQAVNGLFNVSVAMVALNLLASFGSASNYIPTRAKQTWQLRHLLTQVSTVLVLIPLLLNTMQAIDHELDILQERALNRLEADFATIGRHAENLVKTHKKLAQKLLINHLNGSDKSANKVYDLLLDGFVKRMEIRAKYTGIPESGQAGDFSDSMRNIDISVIQAAQYSDADDVAVSRAMTVVTNLDEIPEIDNLEGTVTVVLDSEALINDLIELGTQYDLKLDIYTEDGLLVTNTESIVLESLMKGEMKGQLIPAEDSHQSMLEIALNSWYHIEKQIDYLAGFRFVVSRPMKPILSGLQEFSTRNFITMLMILIVTLGILSLLSRLLAMPLERVAENADRLSKLPRHSELGKWPVSNVHEIQILVDKIRYFLDQSISIQHKREVSERRLQKLAELASDWIWETDEAHRFTYFSQSVGAVHAAHAGGSAIGRRRFEVSGIDLTDTVWQKHLEDLESRRPFKDFTYRIEKNNGSHSYIRTSGIPQFDENDQFLGYIGVASDITEYLRVQLSAEQSKLELKSLIEGANVPIFGVDFSGRVMEWNHASELALGINKDKLLRLFFVDEILPADQSVLFKNLLEAARNNEEMHNVELRLTHQSGHHVDLLVSTSPLHDEIGGVRGMMLIGQDISLRKRDNEALRLERDFVGNLLDSLETMIFQLDKIGRIKRVNKAVSELAGRDREALIGMNWFETAIDSDDVPFVRALLSKTVREKKTQSCVLSITDKNHRALSIDWRITPLINSDKSVEGFVVTGHDITAIRETEAIARRSQKMAAVGQLSGGVAHDFNNILGIIVGNCDLLETEVGDDENLIKRIRNIMRSANRGTTLVRQLLSFSAVDNVSASSQNLNELLNDMHELIQRSVTARIDIVTSYDTDLWSAMIDPGDFHDAVINMVINAAHAMPNGGSLSLSTDNVIVDENKFNTDPRVEIGSYIRFTVSDTGSGMSGDVIERIYEPFFTTKKTGEGSGLGLAMVFSFVERSSGFITVESFPGVGTRFDMYFPKLIEDVHHEQKDKNCRIDSVEPVPSVVERHAVTVLVVDDENALLELAAESLEAHNYNVLTAENGNDALSILTNNQDIQILFSDVVMPGGVSGVELAERARRINPKIKILLTSGFIDTNENIDNESVFIKEMLPKPYRIRELLTRMQHLQELISNPDV